MQSLQVEVRNTARKIEELHLKIEQNREDQKKLESSFVGQFNSLESVYKKLNELSQKLSNPAQVDWQAVAYELQNLESVWNNFYNTLLASQTLEQAKVHAENVGKSMLSPYIMLK